MGAEENKTKVRRIFENGINQANLNVFDELLGADYVNHSFPGSKGPEGFKQVIGGFLAAFPDMHVAVEDMLAEGDRVASRGVMTGTQSGEFMGIPATGKPIRMNYIDVWRVEDGKLVENWVQLDQLAMMQQLGVVPEPQQGER